jgi:hypothetical protein
MLLKKTAEFIADVTKSVKIILVVSVCENFGKGKRKPELPLSVINGSSGLYINGISATI